MSAALEVVRENIASIKKLEGFDVVIICCSSSLQASYWQKRFEDGKGSTLAPSSLVIAVEEDWPGGAGNGKSNKRGWAGQVTLSFH